jgi:hypothetical protein
MIDAREVQVLEGQLAQPLDEPRVRRIGLESAPANVFEKPPKLGVVHG